MYRHVLDEHGFEVVEAIDGRDALLLALTRPPSVVVTALTLQHIDGFSLCEILRKDPLTTHVPVIVVTSEARPEALKDARLASARAVFTKPVRLDALCREIASAVESAIPADAGSRPEASASAHDNSIDVRCPLCYRPMAHQRSHVGGVRQRERWDYYFCPSCTRSFQYRHRTKKLKPVI